MLDVSALTPGASLASVYRDLASPAIQVSVIEPQLWCRIYHTGMQATAYKPQLCLRATSALSIMVQGLPVV